MGQPAVSRALPGLLTLQTCRAGVLGAPDSQGQKPRLGDSPQALPLVKEQNQIRTQVWLPPSQCPARVQGEQWRAVRSVLLRYNGARPERSTRSGLEGRKVQGHI